MELIHYLLILLVCIILFLIIYNYTVFLRIRRKIKELTLALEYFGETNIFKPVKITSHGYIQELAKSFNTMSAKIKQQTDEFKEREERLEHFYRATFDGIILHDNGNPILTNQAMSNMTGYSEKEILKMNVYKIIQERHIGTGFKIPLKPITYETQAIKKDGTKMFVEVQESAIEYEGKMIRALVIRNISKRVMVEKQLREERLMRLSWVIDGQEIERQRLARELHDGLGQSLIALKLKLESVEVDDAKNQKKLEELRKLFNKTIDEIRRISYDLMPAGLNEFGIVNAMQRLCAEIEDHTSIKIEFEADKNLENLKLSEKCSMYLYRITQEAINNSVKHAEASVISVNILKIENFIVLSIADNGKGFKFEATHKYVGNGIYNMRERVNMLEGTFEVNSEIENGTEVIVKIPMNCL
ncbi:MAG: histidine kinase [Bacteroidota bacterium]